MIIHVYVDKNIHKRLTLEIIDIEIYKKALLLCYKENSSAVAKIRKKREERPRIRYSLDQFYLIKSLPLNPLPLRNFPVSNELVLNAWNSCSFSVIGYGSMFLPSRKQGLKIEAPNYFQF